MIRYYIILCFISCCISCATSKQQEPYKIQDDLSISTTKPCKYDGLKQVVAFQNDLFSGSKPEGESGMNSLINLEVATIICVDGISPDVEGARKRGIQTIHIPLKYNAPTETQVLDLCAAFIMNKNNGNVYIHCHHGKHRSAAAAALISIALKLSNAQEMIGRMRVSETSQHYTGLWDAVKRQKIISMNEVIKNKKIFPASVKPTGITSQMIDIDEALDRLLLVKKSNWTIPDSHPDLAPTADAGLIAEIFRSMKLEKELPHSNKDFLNDTNSALQKASRLEEILKTDIINIKLFDEYLNQVEQSCIQCHKAWRK